MYIYTPSVLMLHWDIDCPLGAETYLLIVTHMHKIKYKYVCIKLLCAYINCNLYCIRKYVYMYYVPAMHIALCTLHMCHCMFVCTLCGVHGCRCVCVYACECMCACVYVFVCVCVCVSVHMCACVYVFVCARVSVCLCVFVWDCVFILHVRISMWLIIQSTRRFSSLMETLGVYKLIIMEKFSL